MAKAIRATLESMSTGTQARLQFMESDDGYVFVYTSDAACGGLKTSRYGDKLTRSWVRAYASDCGHKVVKF